MASDNVFWWRVDSCVTEAWLMEDCSGTVTRIDLDISKSRGGIYARTSGCTYVLHGASPEGEKTDSCPEPGPAPASFIRSTIEAGFRKPEDKGFGDTFANMAKAVGADKAAKIIKSLGGDCGCDDRQQRWNNQYPYEVA